MLPLNFFSRGIREFLLLVLLLLIPMGIWAINISSVYFSSCMRENGVIINVDENHIELLTLDGKLREIPRFDIIYISYYPLGQAIRIPEIDEAQVSKIYTIKTLYGEEVVDLVTGWLIDHSEDEFSFLSLSGIVKVVDIDDIWDIEVGKVCINGCQTEITKQDGEDSPNNLSFSIDYEFVHAYPFQGCRKKTDALNANSVSVSKIYPQYLMNEPLLIKRELDRLNDGYDRLEKFEENRVFYPVPRLYGNDTALGFWVNIGNRYGSSNNRNNSFLPFIKSELNEEPFGFQRVFLTGVAPVKNGIHEEPQFQVTYTMKSSYVHFSLIVDASRFNIGQEKYKWSEDEMEIHDDRANEIFSVSGGFDYGAWAVDMTIMQTAYYAVRHEDLFHRDDIENSWFGIFYQDRFLKVEFYQGQGSDKKPELIPLKDGASPWEQAYIDEYNNYLKSIAEFHSRLNWYRLNVELFQFKTLLPRYSLIWRGLQFERKNDEVNNSGAFTYASNSLTNALYFEYPLNFDLKLSGYLSVESIQRDFEASGISGSGAKIYPKAGLSTAFLF